MFEFLGNIASATVKVAVTPLAVVKDIIVSEPFEETEDIFD